VYSPEVLRKIADLAVEHGLIVMADEIYDKILYDDAVHTTFATIAPDVFTITFNGLIKGLSSCRLSFGLDGDDGSTPTCSKLH